MNLSEKIELIIKRKQMSSTQFADILGIPKSSISHILSGRNKPSLDVVQKILGAFPEISAEDLLFEDRSLSIATPLPGKSAQVLNPLPMESLFVSENIAPLESPKNILSESTIVRSNLRRNRDETKMMNDPIVSLTEPSRELTKSKVHLSKEIERVIIFYSDGTFSDSRPHQ